MAALSGLDIFFDYTQPSVLALRADTADWDRVGRELPAPAPPHHLAYGSVPRRFLKTQQRLII